MVFSSAARLAEQASPSTYVARLRRAFLLNTHPDRFRSHSEDVRRGQAQLLQAVNERMACADMVSYTQGRVSSQAVSASSSNFEYYLQKKNGSLVSHSIELNDSVQNVLSNMARALEETTGLTQQSPPPVVSQPLDRQTEFENNDANMFGERVFSSPREAMEFERTRGILHRTKHINHRFDVNSRRGKDLKEFLFNWDNDNLVLQNRAHRIDATVAALVARRAYGFSAVDGTKLNWSSASLAKSLLSLKALHEEYSTKLHVESFYPFRMEMTNLFLMNEEDNPNVIDAIENSTDPKSLDMWEGVLRLNPACTPLQWLETLQLVTMDHLTELRSNQATLKRNVEAIHRRLGVKIKKGHSCSSLEYHEFCQKLADYCLVYLPKDEETQSYALQSVLWLAVETKWAARRAKVGPTGELLVGAQMHGNEIVQAIGSLSERAQRKAQQHKQDKNECSALMKQATWQLGVTRVYALDKMVTTKQLIQCLNSLLSTQHVQELMQTHCGGNSIAVAGSGQHCHIGDDGSLVIPWDWN